MPSAIAIPYRHHFPESGHHASVPVPPVLCGKVPVKKTCDALYTHRNTVLYRIRKMQEDFSIPLNEGSAYAGLLLGVSMSLFETRGACFFVEKYEYTDEPEQKGELGDCETSLQS